MKRFLLFALTVFGLLFSSCKNDDDLSTPLPTDNTEGNKGSITVENGYLKFSSEAVFKDFISNLEKESSNNGMQTKSASTSMIQGFKSLSKMKKEVGISTKSTVGDEEEMNQDEYNVMTADNLLLDPILTEVMDTTLRIGIEDRVFKITEYGTFSAPSNKASFIEAAIVKFDKSILDRTDLGDYVTLENEVTFTNSFGKEEVGNQLVQNMVETPTENIPDEDNLLKSNMITKSAGTSFENNLHNGYNVSTYNWKNNSVWQKFWDWIRGKDVSKEVEFDSKHRVQVNVYNVNYGFYASSGIKVKMQKRKKFLFIKYWVGTDADKMAIGFNKLYGEMKYTDPRSFSSITPSTQYYWDRFTGYFNGQAHDFVYTQYKKFDLVKDWVDELYIFLPEVKIVGNTYPNRDLMNKLYEVPADQIYSFLKSMTNKYVNKPIKKQITPKDPRISYIVWGNSTQTFDKDRSYIMGVQDYGRRESKSIRFDRSFGFNFNNGHVGGFVPTEFKIKDLDIFGAAYYSGQWKGVRFINK